MKAKISGKPKIFQGRNLLPLPFFLFWTKISKFWVQIPPWNSSPDNTQKEETLEKKKETWIRLRTFSWTAVGGSFLGPINLTRSRIKSFWLMRRWKRRPQFFTQVSKTCQFMYNFNNKKQQASLHAQKKVKFIYN